MEQGTQSILLLPVKVQRQRLVAEGGYNQIWSVSCTWVGEPVEADRT